MARLAGRSVGLDGVVDQQDNYRRSGFVYAGRNVRFRGRPVRPSGDNCASVAIRPVEPRDLPSLTTFDAAHFGADRAAFLERWALPQRASRQTYVASSASDPSQIEGYATIRRCYAGHKVGPLFAPDASVARALLNALFDWAGDAADVSLDVPQDNAAGVALAESMELVESFETARMYLGTAPALPIERIFGVTTFELG